MDPKAKVAEGMTKFKAATNPVTDETQSDDQTNRIDKKRFGLAIAKVAVGTGVLIAVWKIASDKASKSQDQQDENA